MLQLLTTLSTGLANFVKLNFKKMPYNHESFNDRLTSETKMPVFSQAISLDLTI